MNDKPRTMMLGPHEWRTLVMTGATNLYTQTQNLLSDVPSPDQVKWLHDQLDRLKMQVSAWGASGQQAQGEKEALNAAYAEANERMKESFIANGGGVTAEQVATATPPKKKRGWQKGRKRGPRKPKQGEAVQ